MVVGKAPREVEVGTQAGELFLETFRAGDPRENADVSVVEPFQRKPLAGVEVLEVTGGCWEARSQFYGDV